MSRVQISDEARARIGELFAQGAPPWMIRQEAGVNRHAVLREIKRLRRPAPREPVRSPLRLSLAEREEICEVWPGVSRCGRSLAGWGGRRRRSRVRWLAMAAGTDIGPVTPTAALKAMRRPKRMKLGQCERLRAVVEAKLELRWSPEQISGWLVEEFPDDPEMRVSHETIYLSLFVQAKGSLRKELTNYLRTRRVGRGRPAGHSVMNGQGQLHGIINISERPAEADDRAVPGHWEGDLIFGKGMSAVATLVERHSRFVMLIALPEGHRAELGGDASSAKIAELPDQLKRSLTWDQGEGDGPARPVHRRHRRARRLPVTRSPWQRGTNENTNGLLRQYFPDGPTSNRSARPTSTPSPPSSTTARRQTLGLQSPSQTLDAALR